MTSAGMTVAFADDVGTTLTAGSTYTVHFYSHTGTSNPGTTEYPVVQASSTTKCSSLTDADGNVGVDVEWALHCRLWMNRQNIGASAQLVWTGTVDNSNIPHGCVVRDLSLFGASTMVLFNTNTTDNDASFYTRVCDFRTTFFQLSGYSATIRWRYGVFDQVSGCTSVCPGVTETYTQATPTVDGRYQMVTTQCSSAAGGRPSSEFYRLGSCSVRVDASLVGAHTTVYEDASYAVVNAMVTQGTQAYVNDQLMIAINPDGTQSWALDVRIT
jgi:hypothetical protein